MEPGRPASSRAYQFHIALAHAGQSKTELFLEIVIALKFLGLEFFFALTIVLIDLVIVGGPLTFLLGFKVSFFAVVRGRTPLIIVPVPFCIARGALRFTIFHRKFEESLASHYLDRLFGQGRVHETLVQELNERVSSALFCDLIAHDGHFVWL